MHNGFQTTLANRHFHFADLKTLLAKATPKRSGDELAQIAAENEQERIAAQCLLADVPLSYFLDQPLIDPAEDEVSQLIFNQHNAQAFEPLSDMTVGHFRNWLLQYDTTTQSLQAICDGLTPEMVAAVSKIMRNQDLILVAQKCQTITSFRNTLGLPGRLSIRLQPNHPTDDPKAIAASTLDGLMYACGDAVIGINPATDSPQQVCDLLHLIDHIIQTYAIPTQNCVLAHVTTQIKAIEHKAPLDIVFQSIAGTQKANQAFGIDLALLQEAQDAALSLNRGTVIKGIAGNGQAYTKPNVMYFETGQGSCLSADAHHGIDQQTLEARAYAVAKAYNPLLVNTVVGFIGPEYLYDGKQIMRAGLEDHFCGKLLGLPMGCDACYTNHAQADQNDIDNLITLLTAAGCTYFMGVPGADDVMLGYQSTSFHDAQYLRQVFNKPPAPEFETWLQEIQLTNPNQELLPTSNRHLLLQMLP